MSSPPRAQKKSPGDPNGPKRAAQSPGVEGGATARLAPGLYVVATPLGHLGDMTTRAREVLATCDLIAAEDTRVTGNLLRLFGITRPMLSYRDANETRMVPDLLDKLSAGQAIALVSDAGTPLIADPGYHLVRQAAAAGHKVVVVPGPSALTASLSIAGLPTDRVYFGGFLPAKSAARRAALIEVKDLTATLVFYEAPHRLQDSLVDLAEVLGPREVAVAREMTKIHEEVVRGTLDEVAQRFAVRDVKGEIVVVIAPPVVIAADEAASADALDAALTKALTSLSLKDAVEAVAKAHGVKKSHVYARALALKGS